MSEIDIHDDHALRFIQRVLESNAASEQDRKKAREMVVSIRVRVRKEFAIKAQGDGND